MYEKGLLVDTDYAPGGVLVYFADGDKEIIHVNRYVVDLFECDSTEEFLELVKGSFKNVVYGNNLAETDGSLWHQTSKRADFDHIYYRIRTKRGRIITVDDYGRLSHDHPSGRPVFYVFLSEVTQGGSVDWLTALPSMPRCFEFARVIAQNMFARRQRAVVLVFNIMGLSGYVNRFGNSEGNRVIRCLADILRARFGAECVTRSAENNFYVIAPEDDVKRRIAFVFEDFDEREPGSMLPLHVGAYACEESDDVCDTGIGRARVACELGAASWRSRVIWFTEDMRYESRLRHHVCNSLNQAIAEQWVRPLYQPIVRSATGAMCGEEALIRWYDPKYGELMPEQFVSVLEEAGLSHILDLYVMDCVVYDLNTRKSAGISLLPVSVNISPFDFENADMVTELVRRCDKANISRNLIHIELRESMAITNAEVMSKQIALLRSAGFEVWLDDFGRSFTSFGALQELKFDAIKLDFGIEPGGFSPKIKSLFEGVIQTATKLGVRTLAEGVETAEQVAFLNRIGCNYLQGHYFSHPLRLDVTIAHAKAHDGLEREIPEERAYWDNVSMLNLDNLSADNAISDAHGTALAEFPVGVVEYRGSTWRLLRSNLSFEHISSGSGLLQTDGRTLDFSRLEGLHEWHNDTTWHKIEGALAFKSRFQFYVRAVGSTSDAKAYLIAGLPTMLGTALGSYGDVPVAYAVFRAILNQSGTDVVDTEYVYANDTYCEWLDRDLGELVGRTYLEANDNASTIWFPYCYRAAVLGEKIHDMVYSPEINHWLSFDIAPSPVEGHCIFAFTYADDEHRERHDLFVGLITSEVIIRVADALSDETSYDTAITELLLAISDIVRCDRLYLMEQQTSGETAMTFEWHAEGVEPRTGILSHLPRSEFSRWIDFFKEDSAVLVPEISEISDIASVERMEAFAAQGVNSIFLVPLYSNGHLMGYLGGDNYELFDGLDNRRLLQTTGSFLAARIANNRLLRELEDLSMSDGLTGVLNRRGIDTIIEERMDNGEGSRFILALMDVDDFKTVNDVHGHDVGDEALRFIARRLERVFPSSAVIGRNGGDEFLVMLFDDDAPHAETYFAEFLSGELACELHGERYPLGMSIGYVEYPVQVTNLQDAYSKADAALYSIKLSGKCAYERYNPQMETQYRSQLGFTPRDIAESIPGAIIVHEPGPDGAILFANDELVELFECDDLNDLMAYTGGTFGGIIYVEDHEAVNEQLQGQPLTLDDVGDINYARYRIRTKSGKLRQVINNGRLTEVEGIGKVFYELIIDLDARGHIDG